MRFQVLWLVIGGIDAQPAGNRTSASSWPLLGRVPVLLRCPRATDWMPERTSLRQRTLRCKPTPSTLPQIPASANRRQQQIHPFFGTMPRWWGMLPATQPTSAPATTTTSGTRNMPHLAGLFKPFFAPFGWRTCRDQSNPAASYRGIKCEVRPFGIRNDPDPFAQERMGQSWPLQFGNSSVNSNTTSSEWISTGTLRNSST